MSNIINMLWIEMRKALRSRMPLWIGLGSLFMPLGIAFLIFVSRNPEISQQLGLISAKADLFKYSATDWPTYLGLSGQMAAIGGFFLFVLTISWVFGREFIDGTLKDMLAVPVERSSIVLAKFILVAVWSIALTMIILIFSLVMGALIKLPGGSLQVIAQGSALVMIAAFLSIAVVFPFAFLASAGRGYLLPLGGAVLAVMMANVVALAGWGEYFPWAVPGLYAMGQSPLMPVSYWIVVITGLVGMLATYLWWMYSDQNR
jgi:ABC-2 type transport system permease protein